MELQNLGSIEFIAKLFFRHELSKGSRNVLDSPRKNGRGRIPRGLYLPHIALYLWLGLTSKEGSIDQGSIRIEYFEL